MVVLLPAAAWGDLVSPWKGLPDHTLVIVVDPTRGGGGPGGPITCYLAGRVYDGRVEEWTTV